MWANSGPHLGGFPSYARDLCTYVQHAALRPHTPQIINFLRFPIGLGGSKRQEGKKTDVTKYVQYTNIVNAVYID